MSSIAADASGLETYLRACADRMRAAATPELETAFDAAVEAIVDALTAGKPLLICGNGGSMADAQHIAGELVARFLIDRKALPAIALGANAATLTAWGNDIGFAGAFAREVEAFGAAGGVLLAISTSGNSPNVLAAVEQAKTMDMTTVALTGGSGGKLAAACDISVCPKAEGAAAVQELHTPIFHRLCELVEARCAGV